MSEKLIVHNRSKLPMAGAIRVAANHVERGRISDGNKAYCYGMKWAVPANIISWATRNRLSDTIYVCDDNHRERPNE